MMNDETEKELRMRIDILEKMLREALSNQSAPRVRAKQSSENPLKRLTPKQLAVTLARVQGLTFSKVASIMDVDDTTVKLHMKAALNHVTEAKTPEAALEILRRRIDEVDDGEFPKQFNMRKDWWIRPSQQTLRLLAKSRATTPPPGGKSLI
ncbi:MAG: hypothetical protein HC793_01785 [Aquincola sp.]|nr:hypothetical protein [Aquincola sp.]